MAAHFIPLVAIVKIRLTFGKSGNGHSRSIGKVQYASKYRHAPLADRQRILASTAYIIGGFDSICAYTHSFPSSFFPSFRLLAFPILSMMLLWSRLAVPNPWTSGATAVAGHSSFDNSLQVFQLP